MANQTFTDGPTLNDGVKMPWLGLGVWKTKEGEEVIQSVKSAIAAGYRSIDTAAIYGNEEGVGQAIRESGVSRDELFITTKVWNDDQGYEKTLQAFETSRKKLGLDIVDLYLVHWPGKDKYLETWKALIHLQKEGLVRSIGVSNFQIRHLQHIIEDTGVVPVVNQVELHPLLSQKELLGYARENHIVLEAWSPLMQGNLDQPALAQIAEKYGKTTAQVILRWDIQNGVIVIPKSIKDHRIRENAGIFDFELSAEDMAAIDGLNQNKRFGSNPDEFLF
ncbi:aldo/keto reductase [Paenibacillus lautus]|jgi:diketogulonate reductase-like aldo/keto reductase|uniref:Aldo/keto reductase n=1 Tax=Paenibacillus lautus TaxID=1401 RepID=A0A2A5LJU0_PAELA|nr:MULTISPECIES: aldo/keto reductase [Paenibacillus]VTR57740.1 aldo/keto reductase [Actinobacillus pleuropneumoniae]ACX62873.1 2,5-didehydrogluconate reductase [Paenibacillus sp. Y412MC10]AYB46674.1 aldo/keto reductase [Paenibacillus lautus]EGG34020.1 glyoxal reductase [Paenibacillus sp. HGF5]ETT59825.1 2,5-didehydrogluconate reductase [Paenibacillus sp. FSL H8-457]